MVSWEIVYAKQSLKDAKKHAASGLNTKAQELLAVLANDPFQNPPPFEKLVEDLAGAYFRRINIFSTVSCMKYLQKKEPFAFYVCGRTMIEQADYLIAINKARLS